MAAHDVRVVANELIRLSLDAGRPLTPMQIIKLVYLCHGWMLGLYGRPLVRQVAQAWRYGPVFNDLYQALKHYGSRTVTEMIGGVAEEKFDDQERDLICQVFKKYGHLTGIALSNMTHTDGSPWHVAFTNEMQNAPISNDVIADYFARWRPREQRVQAH
jgi:uncharacterized phage-associated protein